MHYMTLAIHSIVKKTSSYLQNEKQYVNFDQGVNKVWGKNVELSNVKLVGIYRVFHDFRA